MTYNIINALRTRHEIGIVSLVHSEVDRSVAEKNRGEFREIHVFDCRPKWDVPSALRSLLSSRPYKAIRFWNEDMAECVGRFCSSDEYDLVHAENYYAAQYVPKERKIKAVQYKENFESKILRRYGETQKNPIKRLAIDVQYRRTKRYEMEVCRRFDRTLVISPVDLEQIREEAPDLDLEYAPASIDTSLYSPSNEAPDGDKLVYVGGLDYFPNYDGLIWFYREVFPHVKAVRPNVVFSLVGRGSHPSLEELKRDGNIRFTGYVSDVRPSINEAMVYVVPLRIGGGVKLKILEAMAMGKAVVTTSIGAEGIEALVGRDLIVADSAETFAHEVVELLSDPRKVSQIGRNARRVAEKVYSTSVVVPNIEKTYFEVVQHR